MNPINLKSLGVPTLSLFTSTGTLVCCALPALMVTLGMGATLAGLVSTFPWLIALSKYKGAVFGGAFVMLCLASLMQYKARNAPCPADPKQAKACARLRKISIIILIFSWIVYSTGFFFAFLAAKILL